MALFEMQPTGERRPTRQFWILLAGIAVLVIVVIIGLVLGMQAWRAAQQRQVLEDRIMQQVDDVIANCANTEHPETCEAQRISDTALATGSTQACSRLEGIERDNCVWAVARQQNNPETCKAMQDPVVAAVCMDSILVSLAVEARNPDLCSQISDANTRSACDSTVRRQIADESGCAEAGIDQRYCDARAQLQIAVAARDPALCDAITEESVRAECVEGIGAGDPDLDGLDSEAEAEYGTDPRNADTDADGITDVDEIKDWQTDPLNPDSDGDGFSDGLEVDGGYNPLGPGILE